MAAPDQAARTSENRLALKGASTDGERTVQGELSREGADTAGGLIGRKRRAPLDKPLLVARPGLIASRPVADSLNPAAARL
jgi:hypothetical protein